MANRFAPYVSTFSCFAVARALDSIRVLISQPRLNVKIMGGYAGLLTGMTGKTHQMFDDVAIMRTLPHMLVLAPADETETRQAIRTIASLDGPAYMQITRERSPSCSAPTTSSGWAGRLSYTREATPRSSLEEIITSHRRRRAGFAQKG